MCSNCSNVWEAVSLEVFMESAVLFREVTCEEVSSTILPISKISSFAFCVSVAWLVAPVAISETARSTFCTVVEVSAARELSSSDVLYNRKLCSLISEIILISSLCSVVMARAIIPVSSLRLEIFVKRWSSFKFILARFPIISAMVRIGLIIFEIV